MNTLSWRAPTTPLPMENDPRAVFERLFGEATAPSRGAAGRMQRDRSILDSVTEKIAACARLGAQRSREARRVPRGVRDVEHRIQQAEAQRAPAAGRRAPGGSPGTFDEHAS